MQHLKHYSVSIAISFVMATLCVARLLAQDAGATPASRSAPDTSSRAPKVALGTCRSAGRLSCDQVPSSADPKSLCEHLTACLENRRFSEGVIQAVVLCERLSSEIKLRDGRVHALAAISAIVETAEGQQFQGAYLVGAVEQGWCVVDELLDPIWSPNGCEAAVRIAPDHPREQMSPITVSAQRTCYDTRDQQELAQGESNLRSVSCVSARYAVVKDGIRRLNLNERDGTCSVGNQR